MRAGCNIIHGQVTLTCVSLMHHLAVPVWSDQAGDVYAIEPKPLKMGEEKHIVSVFVADEAGLINRVAGVFARRGMRGSRYCVHVGRAGGKGAASARGMDAAWAPWPPPDCRCRWQGGDPDGCA